MIIAILLDRSQENIFYAGEIVTGNVRVETNEEIKMRGIRLEVYGDAMVLWSEGAGNSRRTYSGNENFIDLKLYLTGSDNNDSEMILKPGVHTFPLSFVLPDNVPSSFEKRHRSIKYIVKAIIVRPWKIDNSTEIQIAVVRWLNLNHEPPQLREPIVVPEEKPLVSCWYHCCCITGLFDMELRINKGCFVPGETIILSGQVINKSNIRIKKTTIVLVQETQLCATYKGQIYRRVYQDEILHSIRRQPIEIGCSDTWNDISFTIPPVVASRLDGCNIITISYLIQVNADFGRGCAPIGIRKEIIIGHVPLQGDAHLGGPITTEPPMYASPFQPGTPFAEQSNYSGVHNEGFDQDHSAASVDLKIYETESEEASDPKEKS